MARDGSDRPVFDVYGMLLILAFCMTLGAALLLNDDLSSNWGFKLGGDAPAAQPWHITQYRDLTKSYNPNAPYIDVRQKDMTEWKLARNRTGAVNGNNFPVKDYEWPAGYKVNEFPVDPLSPNNWEYAQPNANDDAKTAKTKADMLEQYNLLLNSATKEIVPEAPKEEAPTKKDDAAAPAAPTAPAAPVSPATPDKKDDATPKPDALKADAPKTDAK